MIVHLVLQEDRYETTFGDGYYAYLCAAFRDFALAHAWAAAQPQQDYAYHVRHAELVQDAAGTWSLRVELKPGERANADEAMRLLNGGPT